jgi:CRISPR-associated protein (Cas_Csd1)
MLLRKGYTSMAVLPNKGYLLGKLLALLEQEGVVEARQYSAASSDPSSVLVPAIALLAGKGQGEVIMEIMNELPMDALSSQVLSAEEQASFPMGYYQQKARAVRVSEQMDEEGQFSAHLLIRLEPSLKEWIMSQGGSKFVRKLLRSQRARGLES